MKSVPRRSAGENPQEGATPLDIARCPKCNAPMTPRHSRSGPYFHCRCRKNHNPAPRHNRQT